MQKFWHRDLAQEVRVQRSCTSGPITGFWHRIPEKHILDKDPHTEILHKLSYRTLTQTSWQRDLAPGIRYRSLAPVVIQNLDAETLTQTYGMHKRIANETDLGQEIRIESSCASGPTGSWCRHPEKEILHKRSADRDLAPMVLKDFGAQIRTERSCTSDPHTEILPKWSYRILMQRFWHGLGIKDFQQREYRNIVWGLLPG